MTITSTLADRTARMLGRRSDRRSFLVKAAVAGSAAVVAGREYVLKPGSAYAGVCSCRGRSCDCGALCCDGYTEFCCAIYGSNSCPPGTLLAGWWKVDNSSFCNGAARYYMDCNDQCGGCGCGGSGVCSGSCTGAVCQCRSCGNRKDGCTQFRYGNCNNQIACVGPIMCRVVTCTKPWEIEPTCTTATRVDNNTRNHHRPCLEEPVSGPPRGSVSSVVAVTGGYRIRGTATDPDASTPIKVQVFVDRKPVQSAPTSGSSFDVTVAAPPGSHEICVYAQNAGPGEPVLLGCVTRTR